MVEPISNLDDLLKADPADIARLLTESSRSQVDWRDAIRAAKAAAEQVAKATVYVVRS